MNRIRTLILPLILLCGLVLLLSGCFEAEVVPTTTAPSTTDPRQAIDADVSESLRSFFVNELPSVSLKSGVKTDDGTEISCSYSMLKKSVFVDYDNDGAKEIVLLYDLSETTGNRNQNVAFFLDEKDGSVYVVYVDSASYGSPSGEEVTILTRYDNRICKVHFDSKATFEAVVVDAFTDGKWTTILSAYKHKGDHDGVKLDAGSCYIDHSGGNLYQAALGKQYYSKEKFLNFRTPEDNYNNLVTNLLAETVLP